MKRSSYLERAEIEGRFADSAKRNFGDKFSGVFSTGSFAYLGARKGKSDLDVVTIFKDDIYKLPKPEIIEMISGFAADYYDIHRDFNYKADQTFPGEYITEANVQDALSGRGMHADGSKLYLPTASDEYYLSNQEHYYRAWQSMLAFNRRIDGDSQKFEQMKLEAWELIIKFLLTNAEAQTVSASEILRVLTSGEDKWQGVGVTKNCLSFTEDERPFVEQALVRLKIQGLLQEDGDQYGIVGDRVNIWRDKIVQEIKSGQLRKSAFLIEQKDEGQMIEKAGGLFDTMKDTTNRLETHRYSAAPMKNKYLGDCLQIVYSATRKDQESDNLTDSNIVILIKTEKDPLSKDSGGGKLISREDFADKQVLIRISSACLHGSLGDIECTCQADTEKALTTIGANGSGVFVYMPQDSLGRGMRDKVRDHRLIYGLDRYGKSIPQRSTEESMRVLHPEGYDIRSYTVLKKVFEDIGLSDVEFVFIGKNQEKLKKIQSETGIIISSTISLNESNV